MRRRTPPERGFARGTTGTSARRAAIFATSPTLHLRHQYPHEKQGWWGCGGRGCCGALAHTCLKA
eukprot:scaffold71414_cov50-Phaeocystis_antarctica.AAC.2